MTDNQTYPECDGDLTKEQKSVVGFAGEGDLLVRGMPGCGKTTVIVRRALKFLVDYERQYGAGSGKILIVAYNKSLISFIEKLIESDKEVDSALKRRVVVSTFHALASDALRKAGVNTGRRAEGEQADKCLEAAIAARKRNGNHRLLAKDPEFWKEEIEWIKGWMATSRAQYMQMPRVGRGTGIRVTKDDRDLIFDVFEHYQTQLQKIGCRDWDDLALELYEHRGKITAANQFDHVLVDEAQDFPPAWLICVRHLAKKSLTVAADVAQKIYKRGFSFRDCGINVSGQRSRMLGKSFRCTRTTVRLAQAVRDQMSRIRGNDEVAELPMPDQEGSLPVWIHRESEDQAMAELVRVMKKLGEIRPFNARNVVVVARRGKDLARAQAGLKAAGLPAQRASRDQLTQSGTFIPLTTNYQVKGLEFNHVFIWGLGDSVVPGAALYHRDPDEDVEEVLDYERALLYVSITRAREGVWMFSHGTPCRFLQALDEKLLQKR